jgi:LuxR family maltose regulon positive regulatory protein
MSVSILLTKLFIPLAQPELVIRSRLIEQLNRNLHRKLTLISAPAGFGKTTLVTDWLQSQGDDASSPFLVGWLSLDEGDNDAVRFLTYLITALNRIQGLETDLGVGALQMLQSPQPSPPQIILIAMINEIALVTDKIVLILDDFHLIDAQQVHECLNFLIENLPPQLHLVITTREDPPIPISRLRARGQLNELRAIDLRFTGEETAVFLNQIMHLHLSAADIAALETRTEGWITGLQMAAISMQGSKDVEGFIKSFAGSHRYVLDYLLEEVLEQQTKEIQTFLLKTAVLERLTGSLCDAVTGQENGQETLELLDHSNLFIIPLDNERRWYRYHHLFADLLRKRLRQTRPEQVSALHQTASEWYEQAGFTDDAVEHSLVSEDFERAAKLIEEYIEAIWGRGEHRIVRRWLDGLPVALMFSKPHLCIFHAWDMFTKGQHAEAEQSLQNAEQALDSSDGHPAELEKMILRGRAAAIRAALSFYRGDYEKISKFALQALDYLPDSDLTWRSTATVVLGDAYMFIGDIEKGTQARVDALETSKAAGDVYMILITGIKLTVALRSQGYLERVIELCDEYQKLASENGLSQMGVVGWLMAIRGEVLAELNELEEAIDQAKNGVEQAEKGKDLAMIWWSYLCLIRVLYSMGDLAGAEEVIHKKERATGKHHMPSWVTLPMTAWQVRIWLAQDKLEAAAQWMKEYKPEPEGQPVYLGEMENITRVRILFAQERLDEASRILERLHASTEARGRIVTLIEILNLKAIIFHAANKTDQALVLLEKAITIAQPEGYIRIFVDEGPPMVHLLYAALEKEIQPDYVRKLLAAFPADQPENDSKPQTQKNEFDWIDPLSERELEVLQLIAEGLTNQEISTRLYLSPHTVKTHARNIYSKLGVKGRTKATAKARAMGLLKAI